MDLWTKKTIHKNDFKTGFCDYTVVSDNYSIRLYYWIEASWNGLFDRFNALYVGISHFINWWRIKHTGDLYKSDNGDNWMLSLESNYLFSCNSNYGVVWRYDCYESSVDGSFNSLFSSINSFNSI